MLRIFKAQFIGNFADGFGTIKKSAFGYMDYYKAKDSIHTVVYRLEDQAGSWVYTRLSALGLGIVGISVVAITGF